MDQDTKTLVNNIIRFILGAILAFLAYRLFYLPDFWQILVVGASGAIGIFLVPILTLAFRDLLGKLAKYVAEEVISELPKAALHFPQISAKFLRRPPKVKKEEKYQNPIVLDTSAVIDGRFLDVVKTGFFWATFLVPKFVLTELQTIADSSDDLKRARGRRGLKILEDLKKEKNIQVKILDLEIEGKSVDEKILKMAKDWHAKVLTCDFNLNKVGKIQGLTVLNVNELVNAVKTVILPGEELEIKIIQKGKEKGQGVGYLEDGTMVVVEDGADFVGKKIFLLVSRVIQTSAGKMIFCKLKPKNTL